MKKIFLFIVVLLCCAVFASGSTLAANPDKIRGTIDIYPAINSLGIDSLTRSFPFYGVDLNRVFPGSKEDFLPAQVADGLIEAVKGSDIAIDIHSSNIFLKELPQIRFAKENTEKLLDLASQVNIDFVWIHDAVTVLEATLAHTLNALGTKTLVVEMGVGMRITREYGHQLFNGILNLLVQNGLIEGVEAPKVRMPILSEDGEVTYINADACGVFTPALEHCEWVHKGTVLGHILDPLEGIVVQEIISPAEGILFTLREHPVVYEGSLLARIFGKNA